MSLADGLVALGTKCCELLLESAVVGERMLGARMGQVGEVTLVSCFLQTTSWGECGRVRVESGR